MRKYIQLAGLAVAAALVAAAANQAAPPDMPRFKWENFTTANGLPNNRVYSVAVDGDRVWVGTDNGLALYENGKFQVFTTADGLPQQACLSVGVNKKTHDVWVATMGGAARYSAGRFDTFTQLTSGLANDVVYKVAPYGDEVWFATAAGASRLNTKTNQWAIYNERNTPMYEIWTYSVSPGEDKVYYAVWGAGLLEYDRATDHWKDYNDPDGETEIVLYKDQGLIHEITTTVSYVNNMVWVGTYFGVSRYDGRNWKNFLDKDSGLPSNFMNEIKSVDGTRTWFSTDKGLAYWDGENWAVYRPALDTKQPQMTVRNAEGQSWNIPVTTAPAHNYVFGVDFHGDDIWVATAQGLSHGIRIKEISKK
ncbi:MAG TPA: two-component regulator propeller domain-containing protein [Bryobacteraceae bacterium]|nr:two-component regulator propeller domain-containing protein [Bryobacteraceae bacterium]